MGRSVERGGAARQPGDGRWEIEVSRLEIEDRRKKKERGAGSGEAGVPFEVGLWSRDEGYV
jgi:hypothetical protein